MTRLPSPSSRSSPENLFSLRFGFWFDGSPSSGVNPVLGTGLRNFSDSVPVRVGVPSLLPPLVEEGLVSSFTEGVSSGVGDSHDDVSLEHPGKSNSEDQPFIRRKDNYDSGFASGSSLFMN